LNRFNEALKVAKRTGGLIGLSLDPAKRVALGDATGELCARSACHGNETTRKQKAKKTLILMTSLHA
jgi:hypothetical protein